MKKLIAWFLRSVLHYRSHVVMVNLSRCFPHKSYEEIRQIHDRFYLHLASIFTQTLWFGTCRGERGRQKLRRRHLVEFTNPEEFNRLYNGAPQLMLLQAHTGNWELIGGIVNYSYGVPLAAPASLFAVTYLSQHNERMNRFLHWNRTAVVADQGFRGYVEASQVLRFALRNKDEKFTYSFITDQSPYLSTSKEHVTFMHQDTVTMTAAAKLAVKMDMAVAYLRMAYREDGKGYYMSVVPICDHAKGEDPLEIMKKYYQLLEEDLEKQPWNYLWTHRRWK